MTLLAPLRRRRARASTSRTGASNVAVESGTDQLTGAVQALALADVAIDDVGLRRPTLDEVFLALTGRPAGDEPADPTSDQHVQSDQFAAA